MMSIVHRSYINYITKQTKFHNVYTDIIIRSSSSPKDECLNYDVYVVSMWSYKKLSCPSDSMRAPYTDTPHSTRTMKFIPLQMSPSSKGLVSGMPWQMTSLTELQQIIIIIDRCSISVFNIHSHNKHTSVIELENEDIYLSLSASVFSRGDKRITN